MTENWGSYITNIQGLPGSVMLDLCVAENAPLAERPWRSGLSVKMIQPLDNGLLNREEYNTLMAMGDALTKALDPSAFHVQLSYQFLITDDLNRPADV